MIVQIVSHLLCSGCASCTEYRLTLSARAFLQCLYSTARQIEKRPAFFPQHQLHEEGRPFLYDNMVGCDFRSCSLLLLCSYSSLESDIFGLGHIETTASDFTTGTCAPPSHVFTRLKKLDVTILLDSEDSDKVCSLTRDFARLQNTCPQCTTFVFA